MDGIILYADDDVLNTSSTENKLFQKFNDSMEYSVLPITNLVDLEKTISCVSTFKALLLDWSFRKKTDDDMPNKDENPLECLKRNKIYSLIYIYSRESLDDTTKNELKSIYGDDKIFFKLKRNSDVNEEFEQICKDLSAFEKNNKHMEIPFTWSQSINKSAQTIFSELEQASTNWVTEIMKTALDEEVDPCYEVINIFQNILCESLILDNDLRKSLTPYTSLHIHNIPKENVAKLYRRLLYTKMNDDTPAMTGEIYKFNDKEYGILITPECQICNRKTSSLDFLVFSNEDFTSFLYKHHQYTKGTTFGASKTQQDKESKMLEIFNNKDSSIHLLPSFPFDNTTYNETACIEFKTAFAIKEKSSFEHCSLHYKLNSPYIHQLRQRYIAFFGRYGVPAIPNSLKKCNLGI